MNIKQKLNDFFDDREREGNISFDELLEFIEKISYESYKDRLKTIIRANSDEDGHYIDKEGVAQDVIYMSRETE